MIKKIIPFSLGYLSCLYGSSNSGDNHRNSECKLFLNIKNERHSQTVDYLLQGFWCSKCDSSIQHNKALCSIIIRPPDTCSIERSFDCVTGIQSLFFGLLYDESFEEVQVACVHNIQRILAHGTTAALIATGSKWIRCLKYLLLNKKKVVREAFCSQISSFLEEPVLGCLFNNLDTSNKSKEQFFLEIIQQALSVSEEPQIIETLLESVAEIMIAVDIYNQTFLLSLILLVDQLDHLQVTVRTNASRLIHKCCYFHLKGGLELILLKAVHIRNELFEYLSARLQRRPIMIKEFAEAVLGVETIDLVKKMIPVVLPKLVVSQHSDDQAVETLYELAEHSKTDVVTLVVNWLPKVLAFALHQADDQVLLSALQFYQIHIRSDKQEIFAAALPALLDELVCFLDGVDSDEVSRR